MCSPRRPSVVISTDPLSFYPGIISIINSLGRRIIMTEGIEITNITIPWRILCNDVKRTDCSTHSEGYKAVKMLPCEEIFQLEPLDLTFIDNCLDLWQIDFSQFYSLEAERSSVPIVRLTAKPSSTARAGAHLEPILEILCNENLLGQIPKSTDTMHQ